MPNVVEKQQEEQLLEQRRQQAILLQHQDNFLFGTKLMINGQEYTVEDRGGAIQGNRIDIYMNSHVEAVAWGVKYLPVQVVQ